MTMRFNEDRHNLVIGNMVSVFFSLFSVFLFFFLFPGVAFPGLNLTENRRQ